MVEVISLESKSSLDFLDKVFSLYKAEKPFIIKRENVDLDDYPGIEISETLFVAENYGWGKFDYFPNLSKEPAQIVFSSGTEGKAKPIAISHRNLADVAERLNDIMHINEEIREYVGVPVTYSFGIGRVRAVAKAGGLVYIPQKFDLLEIKNMLEADEINAISAVPSLWRIVLQNKDLIKKNGHKIKWIEIGSQYMSKSEKEQMKSLFPNARIVQHYGLTEASRTTFLVVSDSTGEVLESVGNCTGKAEIKVNEKGAICIRGEHTALGIIKGENQISPILTEDGWLETKDKGEIRNGYVYFLGRLDDQINVSGIKVSSEKIEQQISELISVQKGLAVTSIPDKIRGEGILVAISGDLQEKKELIEKAAEIVLNRNGIDPLNVLKIILIDTIPFTDNGKVKRNALRDQYQVILQQQPSQENEKSVSTILNFTETEKKIADQWRKVIGRVELGPDDTFYKAGGDSLSSIQISILMESEGFPNNAIKATLNGNTISEIAKIIDGKEQLSTDKINDDVTKNWTINAVRGLAVLSVLISHWWPGVAERIGIEVFSDTYLAFIYKMGTISFAFIFGISIGATMLDKFEENKVNIKFRIWRNLKLVFFGYIILSLTYLTKNYFQLDSISSFNVAISFYNVIAYYVIALMTVYIWIVIINKFKNIKSALLLTSLFLIYSWYHLRNTFSQAPLDNFLELPRLLIFANYSYLLLTGFAFAGIAFGIWYIRQQDLRNFSNKIIRYAFISLVFSIIVGIQEYGIDFYQGRNSPFFTSIIGSLFYFSLIIIAIGYLTKLVKTIGTLSFIGRSFIQSLIVTGTLALPIYVFHGVVIPSKDILVEFGFSDGKSLIFTLAVFLCVFGYSWIKIYSSFFLLKLKR